MLSLLINDLLFDVLSVLHTHTYCPWIGVGIDVGPRPGRPRTGRLLLLDRSTTTCASGDWIGRY